MARPEHKIVDLVVEDGLLALGEVERPEKRKCLVVFPGKDADGLALLRVDRRLSAGERGVVPPAASRT
jgi:hypothetical protein